MTRTDDPTARDDTGRGPHARPGSPTVREIAELVARLREMSTRGAGVDPAERAALLAEQHALIDRITAGMPERLPTSGIDPRAALHRLAEPARRDDPAELRRRVDELRQRPAARDTASSGATAQRSTSVVTVFDAPTPAELERSARAQAAAERSEFAEARRIMGIDDAEIARLCQADPDEIEPLADYDLLDPAQAASYTAHRTGTHHADAADRPARGELSAGDEPPGLPARSADALAQAHAAVAAIPEPRPAAARICAVDEDARRVQLTAWNAHDHADKTDVVGHEDGRTR